LYKSEYKMAYDFMKKAEKKATANEFYGLLGIIYEQMILLSRHYFDLPLDNILKRKKFNFEQRKKTMEVNDMMAEIRWRLQKSNYDKQGTNILEELDNIQTGLENIDILKKSPSLQIQIQESIRMILLQKGDFVSLNKYLENKVLQFKEERIFNKSNHSQKIVMLTWLINTNVKMLDFNSVYKYANEIKISLEEYNRLYYDTYIWTYYQSMIAACFYSNQLKRCLQVLNSYSKEEILKDHSLFHTNYYINTAIIHFCLNDLKKANKYLNKLLEVEFYDALTDIMKVTLKIVELLFYYENKDYKYLEYALKSFKQKLPILQQEKFIRHSHFLKILNLLVKDPEMCNLKTINEIDTFKKQSPTFDIGNNEAINYKIWLLSKELNKSYYPLLIAEIRKQQTELV